jgi:hypothetical protein
MAESSRPPDFKYAWVVLADSKQLVPILSLARSDSPNYTTQELSFLAEDIAVESGLPLPYGAQIVKRQIIAPLLPAAAIVTGALPREKEAQRVKAPRCGPSAYGSRDAIVLRRLKPASSLHWLKPPRQRTTHVIISSRLGGPANPLQWEAGCMRYAFSGR